MYFNSQMDEVSQKQLKLFFQRASDQFDHYMNSFRRGQHTSLYHQEISNSFEQMPLNLNSVIQQKQNQSEKQGTLFCDIQNINSMKQQEKMKREIVVSKEARERRNIAIKGRVSQTDNLGQQFKTLTLPLIRAMESSRLIDKSQQGRIKRFKASNGSLEQFRQLFKNKLVAQQCQQYFSTATLIKNILRSERILLKNKLISIKYLKSLRKLTYQSLKNWKFREQ